MIVEQKEFLHPVIVTRRKINQKQSLSDQERKRLFADTGVSLYGYILSYIACPDKKILMDMRDAIVYLIDCVENAQKEADLDGC